MPRPTLENLATYFIVTFIVVSVAQMLWEKRREIPSILHDYYSRPRLYVKAAALAFLTLTLAGFAYYHAPPFLQWGLLKLIMSNNANPVTQPIVQSAGHGGVWITVFILLFYATLAIVLPLVALKEERIFRAGHHTRGSVVIQAFKFGLSHLVVGIPIVIALVLVVPGVYFSLCYCEAYLNAVLNQVPDQQAIEYGVHASHTVHSIYNLTILTILVAGTLFLNVYAGSR
ncbi:MAG: hypothetical protein ACYC9J_11695 [Sulfuricaulis sp.]